MTARRHTVPVGAAIALAFLVSACAGSSHPSADLSVQRHDFAVHVRALWAQVGGIVSSQERAARLDGFAASVAALSVPQDEIGMRAELTTGATAAAQAVRASAHLDDLHLVDPQWAPDTSWVSTYDEVRSLVEGLPDH